MSRMGPKTEHLKVLCAATHEIELGDHDFCLSQSAKVREEREGEKLDEWYHINLGIEN